MRGLPASRHVRRTRRTGGRQPPTVARHLLQPVDPLRHRRVGGEQPAHLVAGPERVRDHHVRLRGDLRLRRQRRGLHAALQLAQRRRQRQRVTGEFGAGLVGLVLPRARDRQLDHGRRDRTRAARPAAAPAGSALPSPRPPNIEANIAMLARPEIDRGHRTRDRRDQDVAVVDVRELVAEHGPQLPLVEDLQDAAGAADRRVARVAAGGEGVRRGRRADVEPGHRLVRGGRQLAHDLVDDRRLDLGDRLRVHGLERQLVAVEVRVAVHPDREDDREA